MPIYKLSGRNSIEETVPREFVPLPDMPHQGGRQSEGITTGGKKKYQERRFLLRDGISGGK
jgi:hypothetical protein